MKYFFTFLLITSSLFWGCHPKLDRDTLSEIRASHQEWEKKLRDFRMKMLEGERGHRHFQHTLLDSVGRMGMKNIQADSSMAANFESLELTFRDWSKAQKLLSDDLYMLLSDNEAWLQKLTYSDLSENYILEIWGEKSAAFSSLNARMADADEDLTSFEEKYDTFLEEAAKYRSRVAPRRPAFPVVPFRQTWPDTSWRSRVTAPAAKPDSSGPPVVAPPVTPPAGEENVPAVKPPPGDSL